MGGERLNLTKAAIDGFPPAPKGKRAYYYDTRAKGLVVAVTDKGTKSFQLYRWVSGRPERITLGRFGQGPADGLTIEQARKAAADANLQIARGENPNEKKRAVRGETTLGALFTEYLTRHAEVRNKRPDKAKANFRLYLSHWENRKLSQIRRPDIQSLHSRVGRDTGKVTANIAIKLVRVLYNKAIDWELWNKPNPAKGIQLFKERSRDRFLQPDELPRFFTALAHEPNEAIRDYILLSLLTGQRRANLLSMQFSEVNIERGEWRIPPEKTKTDDPYVVPLLGEAITVLKRRQEAAKTDFVFEGAGEAGHLVEPKKGWRRVHDRAELIQLVDWIAAKQDWAKDLAEEVKTAYDLPRALKEARAAAAALGFDPAQARFKDLRIHDLRRTMGSWQAATGASLPMIGRTLHHKNVSTTAIYARLNIDPVREAMQRATTAMMAAGGQRKPAKVTPILEAKRKAR